MFQGTNFTRLLFFSVKLTLFTAVISANLGIISQFASQNGNDWIGPLSIACLQISIGAGSLYNDYMNRWSYKRIVFVGTMGYMLYNSFSVMFLFLGFRVWLIAVIIAGSLLCGLAVSVYFNGINNYIADCGHRDGRVSMYYGMTLGMAQASSLIGNGLSAVLIEPLGQKVYSFLMFGAGLVIALSFLTTQELQEDDKSNKLISQDISGQSTDNTDEVVPFPKLLCLCFGLSGMIISFIFGQFSIAYYKSYPDTDPETLNRMTFLTFMVQGCGEFVGGLLMVLTANKMPSLSQPLAMSGLLFLAAVGIIQIGFHHHLMWLINVGSFFLGVTDCLVLSIALSIASKWKNTGVSYSNFAQALSIGLFTGSYIFVDLEQAIIVYLVYMVLLLAVLVRYRSTVDPGSTKPERKSIRSLNQPIKQ